MPKTKPTICGYASHVCRSCLKRASNLRLRVALFLLVSNFPLGYGGIALFSLIAGKTGDARWVVGGGICYGLSWAMLLAGTALAGASAGDFSRIAKGGWRAWKRMRAAAVCVALLALAGCCGGVRPPDRPVAYMYPSLMPMSALASYHRHATSQEQARALLEKAGMDGLLAAYNFLESDYSVLARGLSSRGYCEIDGRNCSSCPLRWLYIAFTEKEALLVARLDARWKGRLVPKQGEYSRGVRGELLLRMPLPDGAMAE